MHCDTLTATPAHRHWATGPRIGPIQLDSPFVQAALSGYSDRPMRVLARRHGASYTLAEVMLERFVNEVRGAGRTSHYLHVAPNDHPVAAQLMGSEPENFGPAAQRLVSCGFDAIDINFGCPVRTAMGGCRGGFHLSQPRIALEIVARVRGAVPDNVPVTVKMRRGIDDTSRSRDRFFEILHGAFACGVAAVTVHARTVEQKYVGPSRWEFLREVKAAVPDRTVLGSGDLFSAADCVRMIEETGVDGVTIARGAIANPWIFSQARALWRGEPLPPPPTVREQRDVIEEHRALAEECHGHKWLGTLRKFGFKYARLHPDSIDVRNEFSQVRTVDDWTELLIRRYGHDAPGKYPDMTE